MASESTPQERDYYRTEAMGAFAHEIRTPLTSLRMVVELARRQAGTDGSLLIDEELAGMLHQSIDDLQQLADDIQEASRLERGKIAPARGPCDLAAAVEAARDMLCPAITLEGPTPPCMDGPWDAPRLVRAIAGFAESANRIGDGSGSVGCEATLEPGRVTLTFTSGSPNPEHRDIAADAGFSFFRSRQYILAAGGAVDFQRGDRYARYTVTLPMTDRGGP